MPDTSCLTMGTLKDGSAPEMPFAMNNSPQDKQPNNQTKQLPPSTEYAIAAVGGLLGGLVGLVASPLVLYFLSKKYTGWVKWALWAAIGVVGAPIGAAATVGMFGEAETVEQTAEVQPEEQSTSEETQTQNVSDKSYGVAVTKTGLDFSYDSIGTAKVDGNQIVIRYLELSDCSAESPNNNFRQEWETTFNLETQTWTDRVKPITTCLGDASGEWLDYVQEPSPFEIEVGANEVIIRADVVETDGSLVVDNAQVMRIDKEIAEALPSPATKQTTAATEVPNTPKALAELPDGKYQLVSSESIDGMEGTNKRIPLEKAGNSVIGYAILYPDDNACFTGTIEGDRIVDITYVNPPYGGDQLWTEPRSGDPLDIKTYEAKTADVSVEDIDYCKEGFETAQNQPVPTGTSIPEKPAYLTAQDENARINVRSQPTTNSTASHYGVPGDKVVLLKEAPGSDGFTWYQVRFEVSGAVGWVRSDFIDLNSPATSSAQSSGQTTQSNCDPSYPDVCIPPAPPDLDCDDIAYRGFRVTGSDPHRFDREKDGIGCEN